MRVLVAIVLSALGMTPLVAQSSATSGGATGRDRATEQRPGHVAEEPEVVSYVFTTSAARNVRSLRPVVERRGGDIVWLESDEGERLTLPRGQRGFLGVHVVSLSPQLRVHLGAGSERGVLVSRVVEPSPAKLAGIAVGDLLLEVNGEPILSEWDLKRWIAPKRAGEAVRLLISRDGTVWPLEAALEGRRPRTLDLAPLIRTDERGRTVLIAPLRSRGPEDGPHFSLRAPHTDDDTTVHLEHAFGEVAGALRDRQFNELVGAEFDERRALEERIRYLEERLREIEAQLKEAKP